MQCWKWDSSKRLAIVRAQSWNWVAMHSHEHRTSSLSWPNARTSYEGRFQQALNNRLPTKSERLGHRSLGEENSMFREALHFLGPLRPLVKRSARFFYPSYSWLLDRLNWEARLRKTVREFPSARQLGSREDLYRYVSNRVLEALVSTFGRP